jgi:hypothetical protein
MPAEAETIPTPGAEGTEQGSKAPEATETPEQRMDKKLSQEAASWRVKFRDSETRVRSLEAAIAELKEQKSVATTDTAEPEIKGKVASLDRQVKTLEAQLSQEKTLREQATNRANQKTIEATVSSLISEADVLPEARQHAADWLAAKAKLSDDERVVVGDNEELTLDRVKALLPKVFFPPSGVPGSGSKAVKAAKGSQVDLERAKREQGYYLAHKAEVDAALRAGQV